jgi:hypothetical protein
MPGKADFAVLLRCWRAQRGLIASATFVHAATKSLKNFSFESWHAYTAANARSSECEPKVKSTRMPAISFLAWERRTFTPETRSLRRAGTEPDVVAYLLPQPVHLIVINIVVANVGQGPARNVEVEFDADPEDFSSHRVRYPARVKRRVAAVLPQGERYVQLFGAGEDLYRPDPMKDFSIHVHFTDSKGVSRQTTSRASVMEFLGYGGFDPPEYEIAKALNKIAEKLDGWSSGNSHLKIETLTQNEQREIDNKRRERVEQAKQARKPPG